MSTEPTPQKTPGFLDPKANLKVLVRIVVLLFLIGCGVWLFIRFTAGEKAANRAAAVVLRQPIELKNSIENLPASSFNAIGLNLPYGGTVTIDVAVKKGNDIDIYVVTPDQLDKIKNKQAFKYFQGLEAQKTRSYRRSGRLATGSYYLVLLDKTLGILSQPSSDVQVHVRLEP